MRLTVWPLLLVLTSTLCAQTESPPHPFVPVDPSRLPPPGESISAQDLLIPRKAIKELQRSQTALQLGDVRSSARHLEKAIEIYPRSVAMHNSLGSRYFALHEYEKAATEFQKGIELDPRVAQPFNNLSVALFLLQRYSGAEAAARRAIALNSQDPTPRYVLGCILATDKRNPQEAIDMLRETRNEFPDARLLIVVILLRQGAVEEAKNELREYLKIPGAEKREKAECWLARLSQSSPVAGCPAQGGTR